jgi:hypothetical protein
MKSEYLVWTLLHMRDDNSVKGAEKGDGCIVLNYALILKEQNFLYIMYFGLQDTKPPPCPLHLTKQGGSIHWSRFYLYTVCKLVLYISETITMHYVVTGTEAVYE